MQVKQPFTAMQPAELNKEITSIGKVGAKLNARIQLAALNAIWYVNNHGDIGFGQRLVLAMNAGQRKNSLVAFLEKYGKFRWSKETKELVYIKRDDLIAIEEIKESWFEAIKAPEPKSVYDFDKDAMKFIKHMEKVIKDGADIKNIGLYDAISSAVMQYHTEQLEEVQPIEDTTDEEVTEEIKELLVAAGLV